MEKQVHTFDSVWATFDNVGVRLDNVGVQLESVGVRLDNVGVQLERVGVRLDNVGIRLDSVGDRLDSVGDRLDSVGVKLDRITEQQAETDRMQKETDRLQKETDRLQKETALQMKETDRKIDKMRETLGSWAKNQGDFAEEYFFNAFERGKTIFFGEKFDWIRKNKGGLEVDDEYDIVLVNGQSVGIVETKYKAHKNDLPKILNKAATFRINFPNYVNHKIYLGLASMSFYPELEQECNEQGIAVIKQVGETVVINDEHIKAY